MLGSHEFDLREGLVYDPYTKGFDSNFWSVDTTDSLGYDTAKSGIQGGPIRIGDTGLVGSMSSYSQYLYGDFEFNISVDSLSPDSNDGAALTRGKMFGLENIGDTLQRGAAYFEMRYDSVAGGDTLTTRPFRAVIRSEAGTVQRKNITWDTLWGTRTRFRISWEADGYTFLVNDSVYATLGDRPDSSNETFQINTSIPQAIRVSNRTVDTVDTSAMALNLLTVRHTRKLI